MRSQYASAADRLGRWLPLACFPGLLLAGQGRAADDIIADEPVPVPPASRPMIQLMPPQVRVEMRQIEVPEAEARAGGEVRREPYLGVVTAPVSEQLRAQLELPEGIGLTVEAVAKDGPADRGGVRKFDILRKFEDQLVCTAEQLSALVKAAGKGKEVTLTVIRAGKEEQCEVLIDEREVGGGGEPARAAGPLAGVPSMPLELEGLLADILPGAVPGFGDGIRAQVQQQVQQAFQQAQAGGFDGGGGARVLQIYPGGSSQNVVVVADQRGTVEIRETDGKRTVIIRKPSGEELHRGPLDTAADREKVPKAFREMVKEVEGRLGGGRKAAESKAVEQPPQSDEI